MTGPSSLPHAAGSRLPAALRGRLSLPVIASPMFIVSNPDLVIAQCLAGIVGSFPALNARPTETLDGWIVRITEALEAARAADPARPVAPFAVNQIVHGSNSRLEHDLEVCVRRRVPIIITSLRPPGDLVRQVHAYGGLVFHDVTTVRHAEKALEEGVDGLILVCAGAGGHAGTLSPFALVGEVRRFYDGPLALSGAITSGAAILAAQAMGADLAYMGTRFIATREANAADDYKAMITRSSAQDIVYTPFFTGVPGNYLRPSIVAQGLDPDDLPASDKSRMDFGPGRSAKAWRDIWGAGQGVGTIDDVPPAADVVARLRREYAAALRQVHGAAASYVDAADHPAGNGEFQEPS
ncbi:nitronate monooxygenase [Pseudochelatococcus lubricantis]|uniref:Nitronate monooxygenase n=1 Tax=Pseudochelatococcus lubricantis TaxID=1538102 RepID=A0ABX0V182_9HYPH|nr:nitronate monooxygenase family protein [Pseudochelatococcus lubricantis]NIJ57945.1 nitronate monooxygenase [Pseudochelatococcus lubricantis]